MLKLLAHIREIASPMQHGLHSSYMQGIVDPKGRKVLSVKLFAVLGLSICTWSQTSLAFGLQEFRGLQEDEKAARTEKWERRREQEAAAELQSVNAALASERQAFRERLEILKQSRIEFINTLKNLSNQHREADLPLLAVKALVQVASRENESMKENAQQFMEKSSVLINSLSDFNFFNNKTQSQWSDNGSDPFLSLKLILRTVSLVDGPPNPNDPEMDWLNRATRVLSKDENSIVNRYKKSATLLSQAAQSPYVKEFTANEERLLHYIKTSAEKLKKEEEVLNQIAQFTSEFAPNSSVSENLIRAMDLSFLTGEGTAIMVPRGRDAILHQIASARQEIQTIKAKKDAMPAEINAENSIQKSRMDDLAKTIALRIKEIEIRITEHEDLREHLGAKTKEIGNLKQKLIDFQIINQEAVDGFRVVTAGLDKKFFRDRITLVDFAQAYIQLRGEFSESDRSQLDKIVWPETKGRLEGRMHAYENLRITLDGFIDRVNHNSFQDFLLLISTVEDASKNQEILTKMGIDLLNKIKTTYLAVNELLTGKKS
jgi:hypothetical protein